MPFGNFTAHKYLYPGSSGKMESWKTKFFYSFFVLIVDKLDERFGKGANWPLTIDLVHGNRSMTFFENGTNAEEGRARRSKAGEYHLSSAPGLLVGCVF